MLVFVGQTVGENCPLNQLLRQLLLLSLLGALPYLVAADERTERAAELAKLKAAISSIQTDIERQLVDKNTLQAQLGAAERRIGKVSASIEQLEDTIDSHKRTLAVYEDRLTALQATLGEQRQRLAAQVKAAYLLSHRDTLQLLLSQQDPATLNRVLTYADYLNQARAKRITRTTALMAEVGNLQDQVESTKVELEHSRAALAKKRDRLIQGRGERRALLAELEQSIQAEEGQLASMQDSREELERVLKSLDELIGEIPAAPLADKPFRTVKGSVPWPIRGRLTARYGEPVGTGDLRWKGVVLDAPEGTDVRAIYYGRIVFADWLQGFGLIIILDHDDGYMSLYGHNRSLLKESGDWVQPNDIIATVGDSGGHSSSGLYFEIRKDGLPVNPMSWVGK